MTRRTKTAVASSQTAHEKFDSSAAQFDKLRQILKEELAQIRGEQQRARALIAHAARELYTHFRSMNDSVGRMDDRFTHTMDLLLQNIGKNKPESQSKALIEQLKHEQLQDSQKFQASNSSSIKALQFEDMSAQALAGCLDTLDYLDKLLRALDQGGDTETIGRLLDDAHGHWKSQRRSPDQQDSIDEGSIELF